MTQPVKQLHHYVIDLPSERDYGDSIQYTFDNLKAEIMVREFLEQFSDFKLQERDAEWEEWLNKLKELWSLQSPNYEHDCVPIGFEHADAIAELLSRSPKKGLPDAS